jgi:demethoxyubiquinone hydroxylase (CLK1/Coq7/Cat5 family)
MDQCVKAIYGGNYKIIREEGVKMILKKIAEQYQHQTIFD